MFLLTIEVADPANVARHFHAADAVVDKLRTYAPAASAHIHRLPKLRGQCVVWSFHTPGSVELTQFFGDTRRVVLFHGEALELPAGKEAEAIHGHWKEEDPPLAWIEGLDGEFVAVLIDLVNHTVSVICDRLGRKSCRFVRHAGQLWLASHDLPLAIAAPIDLALDSTTLESMWHFGWSIGGKSLIAQINRQQAGERLTWQAGAWRSCIRPTIVAETAGSNPAAIREVVRDIADLIERRAEQTLTRSKRFAATLTAGVDSRAYFGLIREFRENLGVTVKTFGEENDLDVAVARRIAKRCGFAHESKSGVELCDEGFDHNCDVLAAFFCGDTSTKRAIQPMWKALGTPATTLTGLGGEIFRGYYYPHSHRLAKRELSRDKAQEHLYKKFRVTEGPLRNRLDAIVHSWRQVAGSGYDLLDLFYVYERFGNWAIGSCVPHKKGAKFLGSCHAVSKVLMLPPTARRSYFVHRELIAKYLPEFYWTPINNKYFIAFPNNDRSRYLLERWNYACGLLRAGRPVPAGRSSDEIRVEVIQDVLSRRMKDSLLASESPVCASLGAARLKPWLVVDSPVMADRIGVLHCADRFGRIARELRQQVDERCADKRMAA